MHMPRVQGERKFDMHTITDWKVGTHSYGRQLNTRCAGSEERIARRDNTTAVGRQVLDSGALSQSVEQGQ
jgi:hypothetical protein